MSLNACSFCHYRAYINSIPAYRLLPSVLSLQICAFQILGTGVLSLFFFFFVKQLAQFWSGRSCQEPIFNVFHVIFTVENFKSCLPRSLILVKNNMTLWNYQHVLIKGQNSLTDIRDAPFYKRWQMRMSSIFLGSWGLKRTRRLWPLSGSTHQLLTGFYGKGRTCQMHPVSSSILGFPKSKMVSPLFAQRTIFVPGTVTVCGVASGHPPAHKKVQQRPFVAKIYLWVPDL